MPHNRFFLPETFTQTKTYQLTDGEHIHCSRVLRTQQGEWIELVNGLGGLAQAQVLEIKKDRTIVCIHTEAKQEPIDFRLILLQGQLRPSIMDLVIEKATELGVTDIHLFPADHSDKKGWSDSQMARLHLIAVAALKQSGRLYLPRLSFEKPLGPWADQFKPSVEKRLFADLRSHTPIQTHLSSKDTQIALCVGPESGFSSKELSFLESWGYPVLLSPYILRAETAAICGLSLLSQLMLDPSSES